MEGQSTGHQVTKVAFECGDLGVGVPRRMQTESGSSNLRHYLSVIPDGSVSDWREFETEFELSYFPE